MKLLPPKVITGNPVLRQIELELSDFRSCCISISVETIEPVKPFNNLFCANDILFYSLFAILSSARRFNAINYDSFKNFIVTFPRWFSSFPPSMKSEKTIFYLLHINIYYIRILLHILFYHYYFSYLFFILLIYFSSISLLF